MREALAAVLQYGFETMKLQTITACLAVGNEKSIRLLKRFHFVEVPEPDTPEEDLTNYRLTRSDYYPETHV
jgi:RimJ/RimL family protein N-acetyltransferase